MKLSFLFLGITCLVILTPSSSAQHCHSVPYRRQIHRVIHEEVHHNRYVPVAFVDLVQTYFTLPTVQFIPQGQVPAPQAQIPQPLSLPSGEGFAQNSGSSLALPPMATYEDQPFAGGNTQAELLPILKSHCASCHSGPQAKGSFSLFDPAGNLNPATDLADAWVRIKKGEMPPGKPLDPQTQSKLRSLILK